MRFLVIGLGSMGKRRVRNLLSNGIPAGNIRGFDPRADRTAEAHEKYAIETFTELSTLDLTTVDAFVISTGPALHYHYMQMAVEHGKDFFCEAGVHSEGIAELAVQVERKGVIGFPSCTMRYFPGPMRIKALVDTQAIGPVYCWQYQSGQYLPDWHPWESIHDFYVSQRETGGCREIVPFELTWLVDTFGPVQAVDGLKDHLSEIDADIDDIYMLQMRHRNGALGQLIVDVIARDAVRFIRILGRNGTIEWHAADNRLRLFRVEDREWVEEDLALGHVESGYIIPETPYINEIGDFIANIRSRTAPSFSFNDYLGIVGILEMAERSDESGLRQER